MYLFQVPIKELKKHLIVPDGFWDRYEADDYSCNGCGTGITAYIIPNTVYGLDITLACCPHDDGYAIGGTEEDRKRLDDELHDNIEIIIDLYDKWFYPTRAAKLRADTYRAVVNIAGAGAFNYNEETI